jgi:hypothetical protein
MILIKVLILGGCIMKITIKPAYDEINSVKALFTEYTQMLGVNLDFQNYEQELDQLPGKYALPDGRLYIACDEEKAVGCVALRRIEDAAQLKYEYMVLDTLINLESAVNLYKKLGFYEIGPYYENPLKNVIYMRKEL